MKRLLALSGACLIVLGLLSACSDDDSPTGPTTGSAKLYVLNQDDQTIYILNAETLQRIDSISTPVVQPHFVEFSHDGEFYYVIGRQMGGQLAKYDASDNSLVALVTVEGSMFPTALVLDKNDDTAYVSDFTDASGRVHRYNVSGNTLAFIDSSLQAGYQAHDIDIADDGSRIVVAGFNSDELTVFSPNTAGSLTPYQLEDGTPTFGTSPASYGPYGVNIDESNTVAVAACRKGVDQVRIMNLANPTQIDSILIPVSPIDLTSEPLCGPTLMVQKPNSDLFFVTGYYDPTLWVVNINSMSMVASVFFSASNPFTVQTNNDGSRVYVSCTNPGGDGMIYMLDGNSFAKLDSTIVGNRPFGFAWRAN